MFAHSDVISPTLMDSRAERVKEELYPPVSRKVTILVNQSTFCSEFSSTLLVPFVVLGTPNGRVPNVYILFFENLLTGTVLCCHGNIPAEDNEEIRSLPSPSAFQTTK